MRVLSMTLGEQYRKKTKREYNSCGSFLMHFIHVRHDVYSQNEQSCHTKFLENILDMNKFYHISWKSQHLIQVTFQRIQMITLACWFGLSSMWCYFLLTGCIDFLTNDKTINRVTFYNWILMNSHSSSSKTDLQKWKLHSQIVGEQYLWLW